LNASDTIYSEKNMLANIIYNYGAQIFLAAAGLVSLPFLLQRMGGELYAFVAILFTLQTLLSILDGGLSGSLAREFALKKISDCATLSSKALLSKMEPFFIGIAVIGFSLTAATSEIVSTNWLKLISISPEESKHFLMLIGVAASIRLASGLYRSVLIGYENQKQLSIINIVFTSIRYFIVLPFLDFFGVSGHIYFGFQASTSILEFLVLKISANRLTSSSEHKKSPKYIASVELRVLFKKSAQIWTLSILWVISNQLDKVLLSGKLPLDAFGYFSIISTLAGGLLMLGSPITSAAMPKISTGHQQGQFQECKQIYLRVSALLSVIALPLCFSMAALPEHALFLMTGNTVASSEYSLVLSMYAFGSYFLLLAGLTFLLQYAAGNLKKNIGIQVVYLIAYAPTMALAIYFQSITGAAYTYFIVNFFFLVLLIRPLNSLNNENFHKEWLVVTLVKPLLSGAPIFFAAILLSPTIDNRIVSFFVLTICSVLLFALLWTSTYKITRKRHV
jgi:O-antigen/teichoic acid export membrane protein